MVRFEAVSKRYGPLPVLDGLDLEVGRGEKVAIIGPSGSGKTTVLRMLMTLETIDDGIIYVDGEPLTHMQRNGRLERANLTHIRRVRSKIGMVFQSFNLFPHMTALPNCSPWWACRRRRDIIPPSFPAASSSAFARALAMRPKIMLFDEVTSALDPELVGEVLQVIRRLAKEHDLTMLMVTHQMGFAREFADRICFFYQGKICEQGAPDQFFSTPRNERTRQFLRAVLEAG
jgi:polar amino acid transport system ATP-binding protein